jgi:hypothetical protein
VRSEMWRFAHRLALAMHEVDVELMLRRLTAKKFVRWMIYERIEPFGQLRDDYRAALITSEVANTGYDTKGKRFTAEDFLLKFGGGTTKPKKQKTEDMIKMLTIMAHSLAGAPRKEPK